MSKETKSKNMQNLQILRFIYPELVYVDDILIVSLPKYATDATKKFLESAYQMSGFGWPN